MSGFKECSQRIAREVLATTRRSSTAWPPIRRARVRCHGVPPPNRGRTSEMEEGNKRTLQRDHTILKEFDDGTDPGLLALYYHKRWHGVDRPTPPNTPNKWKTITPTTSRSLVLPRKSAKTSFRSSAYKTSSISGKGHAQRSSSRRCGSLSATACWSNTDALSATTKRSESVRVMQNAPSTAHENASKKDWPSHKKLCKLIKESNVTLESECSLPEHADYPKPGGERRACTP